MEVKAKTRFIKMSPRKIRLVANLIKSLDVREALTQLEFMNKWATRPISKLINSAIANAENNFKLEKNNLYIKDIRVDQGPTIKRWQPKAHGRATMIRKKMSHILLVLDERVPNKGKVEQKDNKAEKPDKKKDKADKKLVKRVENETRKSSTITKQ